MAKDSTDDSSPDIPDNLVELAKIDARVKSTRIRAIAACIIIGMVCLTVGIVRYLDQPPWPKVLLAIIPALLGPSGVIWLLLLSRKKFVNKHHHRIVVLEQRLDLNRTSSIEPEENQEAKP